jgi:hypothetical protein
MEFLSVLWLPILLSAAIVFVASSIIHMVFKFHNTDYKKLPGEDAVLAVMREQGVEPGMYAVPRCESMKGMGEPEMVARYEQGPVGMFIIGPNGPPAMGKALALWFVYSVLVAFFAAYLGFFALGRGAEYMDVFRFVGTATFMAYGVASLVDGVWKGIPWAVVWRHVFDGLVYSLVTAGTFAWLWPGI